MLARAQEWTQAAFEELLACCQADAGFRTVGEKGPPKIHRGCLLISNIAAQNLRGQRLFNPTLFVRFVLVLIQISRFAQHTH